MGRYPIYIVINPIELLKCPKTTSMSSKANRPPKPRLPLSAFSPPNTGTSDSFPVPRSPTAVEPQSVIDANVIVYDSDLSLAQWKSETGQSLVTRIGGIVISLPGANLEEVATK
jgi:hypothetical protein